MSDVAPASGAWRDVLESGLGARNVTAAGIPWAVFALGPLRVAYPRFPVSLTADDGAVLDAWPQVAASLARARVDLVRLSAPAALVDGRTGVVVDSWLPATAIEDLPDWRAEALPAAVRRKLRKARAAGLAIVPATAGDGAVLHALYAESVRRKRGATRYPPRYFDALCRASLAPGGPDVAKVMAGDEVAGFIAVADFGGTAFYLHGGYRDRFADARPGYFAMASAIEAARARGRRRFDLATSPAGQPALTEYKESFGGTTARRAQWQVPLTAIGRLARLASRVLARPAADTRPRADGSRA